MANPNAKLIPVNLAGSMNLNKYKADIDTTYSVFNKKNAPIFGGVLSPTYKSKNEWREDYVSTADHEAWINNQGNVVVDGKEYDDFSPVDFHKHTDLVNLPGGETIEEIYDDKFYVIRTNTKYTIHLEMRGESYDTDIVTEGNVKFRLYHTEFQGYENKTWAEAIAVVTFQDYTEIYYFNKDGWNSSDPIRGYNINNSSVAIAEVKSHQVVINLVKNEKRSGAGSTFGSVGFPESIFYYYQPAGFETWITAAFGRLSVVYSADVSLIGFSFLSWNGVVTTLATTTDSSPKYYISNKVASVDHMSYTMTISQWDDTEVVGFDGERFATRLQGGDFSKKASLFCKVPGEKYIGYYTLGNGYFIIPDLTTDYTAGEDRWITFTSDDGDSKDFFSKPGGYFLPFFDGSWRLLFGSDGLIRGISYGSDNNKRGVLVTPWSSVSNSHGVYFSLYGAVYFSELEKKWIRVTIEGVPKNRLKIIGDYLIINTISPGNCLNMKTGQIFNYADDWNNRIYDLSTTPHIIKQKTDGAYSKFISSGANVGYMRTGIPVCSADFPQEKCYCSDNVKKVEDYQGAEGNTEIDLFEDNEYATSYNGYNVSKEGLTYPIGSVYYNPDILMEYIETTTNQDIVKSGNIGYSLLFFNNFPIFLYLSTSQLTSIENMFVIQGRGYATTNNRIVEYSVQNGSIAGTQAVVDVSGLQYISSTPYQALFWSDTNKSMYSFTGDNMLRLAFQANSISNIYGSIYNPATGTIMISTNIGTIFLNESLGTFIEEGLTTVTPYISKNNTVAFYNKEDNYSVTYLKYHNDNQDKDFTTDNIIIETELFGEGNNIVSNTDCWYIRLEDVDRERRTIKISSKIITDVGTNTEEKRQIINPNDWDKETDTYYFKYQPKYQAGVGSSLRLETDAKIASVTVGTKPITVQLSKNNI